MEILSVEQLSKRFGTETVIDDLTFSVPEHAIYGFLGQNGAGKTTTMNMILGLLKPTSGSITVCGEAVTYGQNKTNRFIGYLPDVPNFYHYMTPVEYLTLCGEITGMSKDELKLRSKELLALVGLEKYNKRISGFSRGMKQRLGIAQALLNRPKLLICDEPTSALDPLGRKEILDILQQVKKETTVLFSTHILSDAEKICDKVIVLHEGKALLSGTLEDIKAQHKRDSLLIAFNSIKDLQVFTESSQMKPFLQNSEQNGMELTLHTEDLSQVETAALNVLVNNSILPNGLHVIEPTLESLFIEVTQ